MGLPYRFNVAAEAQFERFNGGGGARSVSLEARWALADWNNDWCKVERVMPAMINGTVIPWMIFSGTFQCKLSKITGLNSNASTAE